ncbi:MAG TPA: glycoside hydrolase family 20 zincin-like fold domain-containing protein [Phycisphaerae bacterium]|nr:glycoside hydrolase family 20 zincin-like fold domain-containing protein [Phycisphaerae bacterium]
MNVRHNIVKLAAGLVLAGATPAVEAERGPVSREEAQEWIRYTVPLPKQIGIFARVQLPAEAVVVQAQDESAPLVVQAMKELREALGQTETPTAPGKGEFTLTLELGGEDAAELQSLKNSDQAYQITTAPRSAGLRLIALGPRGLYYASKTMQQLIKAKARDGQVEMPLMRATDWPDMEDRGLWGGDSSNNLRWMSDRKMNYNEQISHTAVDKDKRCSVSYPPYKQRMIDEGPTYGINPVPVILHLEQLKGMGLFNAYPDLQGKDATEGVICHSNPKFIDVLAEWLVLWGEKPGVKEVDVWMAENMYGKKSCQCDECKKEDRAVLETRDILQAWAKAKQRLPELGLRILTSEASEESNAKIIPMLPRDVKLWYYHSLFTYNTSRAPMIGKFQPYLIDAIKDGRWVGICPNLSAAVGLWMPMTGAAFIHARMNEYVDKGLSGLIGYAVPQISYCDLNTEAAAEWTWNAKGRSTHEFAVSYAVRRGYKDPGKFAAWSETMGPVSWDVYGSEFPAGERRGRPGKMADLVKEGKLPELGEMLWDIYGIPFGDIKTVEQLNNGIAQAEKGVKLAREMDIPQYLEESLVVQGFMNAIKALYELKQVVKPEGVTDKAAAGRWFQAYVDALKQSADHLPAWEKALPGQGPRSNQTAEAVKLLGEMIGGMKETAKSLGVEVK